MNRLLKVSKLKDKNASEVAVLKAPYKKLQVQQKDGVIGLYFSDSDYVEDKALYIRGSYDKVEGSTTDGITTLTFYHNTVYDTF